MSLPSATNGPIGHTNPNSVSTEFFLILFITSQHTSLNRPQVEEQRSTNAKQGFLVSTLESTIYAISGPLDLINHGQPSYSASNFQSHTA